MHDLERRRNKDFPKSPKTENSSPPNWPHKGYLTEAYVEQLKKTIITMKTHAKENQKKNQPDKYNKPLNYKAQKREKEKKNKEILKMGRDFFLR